MAEPALEERMTVDAFIDWAMAQPSGRYELLDGKVYAMSPERAGHARTKARAWQALARAIGDAGKPCEALPDGLTVPIDATTSYEPDALVRCGPPLDADAVKVPDPMIVVEVISPGSRRIDTHTKLTDYFRLASVQHYVVLDAANRRLVCHSRGAGGSIRTSLHHEGQVILDPPGLSLDVMACFPEPDPA